MLASPVISAFAAATFEPDEMLPGGKTRTAVSIWALEDGSDRSGDSLTSSAVFPSSSMSSSTSSVGDTELAKTIGLSMTATHRTVEYSVEDEGAESSDGT